MKQIVINSPWSKAPVFYRESTDSTMEDAQRLFRQGCPEGTLVIASFQEKGRGRYAERSWLAEKGLNLLFTLVLRQPHLSSQRLPVLVGLAVAQTIEQRFSLPVQIKWPNDLLVQERKFAGVLCEALVEGSSQGILIGVGLNCNQINFPGTLGRKATSLAKVLGREVSPLQILEELLPVLQAALIDPKWKKKVSARLYRLGREAVLRLPSGDSPGTLHNRRGIIRGLAEDGALLFQPIESSETIRLYTGEITA
jgi:BirA family biotin operon repressor/biotin-[acetyl-CoA-carboxylase] ligase